MVMIDIEKLKQEQAQRVETMIEHLRNFPEDISDYLAEAFTTNMKRTDSDPTFEKKMAMEVEGNNQGSKLQGQQDMQKAGPLEGGIQNEVNENSSNLDPKKRQAKPGET
jgi:hypothetical protein